MIMVIIVTLFLVSNNLVIDNILYETDEGVEDKRINRPLSIEGEKASVKLVKKLMQVLFILLVMHQVLVLLSIMQAIKMLI